MQKKLYEGDTGENRNNRNNRNDLATAWENLCLQVIITALDEEPDYINTSDCQTWLDRAGIDYPDAIKNALAATQGKINYKRYINERIED